MLGNSNSAQYEAMGYIHGPCTMYFVWGLTSFGATRFLNFTCACQPESTMRLKSICGRMVSIFDIKPQEVQTHDRKVVSCIHFIWEMHHRQMGRTKTL